MAVEPPSIQLPERPWMEEGLDDPKPMDGGVWMTRRYWDANTLLLDRWAQYPGLVEGAFDDFASRWASAEKAAVRIAALKMAYRNLSRATGWAPWKAYAGIILGILGGGGIGFAIGAIVLAVGG